MTRAKDPPGTAKECRSCKQLIVWTTTKNGKSMPCDVEPSEKGTFFLFRVEDRIDAVHEFSKDDPRCGRAWDRDQKKHASHFSTCPNAAEHRKGST